jgi:sugar phosphate isomerase/epimerase
MAALCFNTFNRSAWFGLDPDLPGQVEAAAAAGVELFGPDVFSLERHRAQGGSVEQLRELVAARGIRTYELAALMVGDDADDAISQAERLAELAAVLGAEWILTNVVAPVDAGVEATLERCSSIVAAAGARLAIEYLPWTPVASAASACRLADRLGPERARVLLDVWHHFRGPDGWEELEAVPLDAIAYVQFSDALPIESDDLVSETLHRRVFPGDGEFDLDRYCSQLRAKGFDGVVSVEVLSRALRDIDRAEFARRAFESSSRYWS